MLPLMADPIAIIITCIIVYACYYVGLFLCNISTEIIYTGQDASCACTVYAHTHTWKYLECACSIKCIISISAKDHTPV